MKKFSAALISALLLFSSAHPQNPVIKPVPDEDSKVVKISTDLVQIDVTVTDKNGKIIPDLKAEDFEIFEKDKSKRYPVRTSFSDPSAVRPQSAPGRPQTL